MSDPLEKPVLPLMEQIRNYAKAVAAHSAAVTTVERLQLDMHSKQQTLVSQHGPFNNKKTFLLDERTETGQAMICVIGPGSNIRFDVIDTEDSLDAGPTKKA